MPAARLTKQPSIVHPYDVLAQSADATDLMSHALLCTEVDVRRDVTDKTELRAFHMAPPLGRHRTACDAFGSADLNAKQKEKIKSFIDDRRDERAAERRRLSELGRHWNSESQYQIQPAATPPTPDYPLWRFNCVGFVLQAYRRAGIRLLSEPYPWKTVEDLRQLYPGASHQLDDLAKRSALGIGHGERWPVELVGYILNSLAREVKEIREMPYVPKLGDEYFPPQRPGSPP